VSPPTSPVTANVTRRDANFGLVPLETILGYGTGEPGVLESAEKVAKLLQTRTIKSVVELLTCVEHYFASHPVRPPLRRRLVGAPIAPRSEPALSKFREAQSEKSQFLQRVSFPLAG